MQAWKYVDTATFYLSTLAINPKRKITLQLYDELQNKVDTQGTSIQIEGWVKQLQLCNIPFLRDLKAVYGEVLTISSMISQLLTKNKVNS